MRRRKVPLKRLESVAGASRAGRAGVTTHPAFLRFEPWYRIVRRIPPGRVATYGQVAALGGRPRGARLVGHALSALRNARHDVPWQRVLGARGAGTAGVSLRDPVGAAVQRDLLEREGIRFDARGRIDLAQFGWRARAGRPRRVGGSGPRRPRGR